MTFGRVSTEFDSREILGQAQSLVCKSLTVDVVTTLDHS